MQVRGIVESAYQNLAFGHDDVTDRAVVGAIEGKGARARGIGEDVSDDAAVNECSDQFIRMRSRYPVQAAAQTLGKRLGRLGARQCAAGSFRLEYGRRRHYRGSARRARRCGFIVAGLREL